MINTMLVSYYLNLVV